MSLHEPSFTPISILCTPLRGLKLFLTLKVTLWLLTPSGSTDPEGKVLSFKWTQDNGPTLPLPAMNTAALHLDKLVQGHYHFTYERESLK